MATNFNSTYTRATPRATIPSSQNPKLQNPQFIFSKEPPDVNILTKKTNSRVLKLNRNSRIYVSSGKGGDSYLDMWKNAVDRERKSKEFEIIAENSGGEEENEEEIVILSQEEMERKSNEFQKILEVDTEERDRVQRMQVIDRAAAAISAARALLNEDLLPKKETSLDVEVEIEDNTIVENQEEGTPSSNSFVPSIRGQISGTPGQSFWIWTPPVDDESPTDEIWTPPVDREVKSTPKALADPAPVNPVIENERTVDFLPIPFESSLLQGKPSLPPLQSIVEVENPEVSSSTQETAHLEEERELGIAFSAHAAEAVEALNMVKDESPQGVTQDGTRWWKETGLGRRPDGVVCKWTLIRGVSSDQAVEWEEKYWEAAGEFGYKELGSEKSGRDASGNVWREYWRESMSQNGGLVNLEKTADKWGKNGKGDEWQEQWWEHYGASGQAEKWAHKWCSIDPYTPLDAGHAHVWHERWGEKYDGKGGSTKYTDKWAERFEGDGWEKWGDKWDENFDPNGCGVKQGETWWAGRYGDRWNRTWGEGHNGSGWVHKYGKSSHGEHWDSHVEQDTWYEKFPHYGFYHCFENSVQLREVQKPSEWSEKESS